MKKFIKYLFNYKKNMEIFEQSKPMLPTNNSIAFNNRYYDIKMFTLQERVFGNEIENIRRFKKDAACKFIKYLKINRIDDSGDVILEIRHPICVERENNNYGDI